MKEQKDFSLMSEEEIRDMNRKRVELLVKLLNDIGEYGGSINIIDEAIEVNLLAQDERTMPILIGFDKNTGRYETT